MKKDWLDTTLMLLPAPVIVGWLVAVEPMGGFPEYDVSRLHDFAHWIGLSFLALALAVIVVLFWNFGVNRLWTYSDVK